ncbi:hypothetical protein QNI19_29990 [Cytophagaceae bacterium DM2B3-1]|uniref:Uncharacterized protein n=1 Tax=Xanthocytophaga flava TaxID=3048013 RepID=A0ABT7CTZ0_9BACT|nr:hypothetical protein [Xanthocytophaga flavus]MDJ1497207.1 hypothetical protein [Xanthocytophaga flavus]
MEFTKDSIKSKRYSTDFVHSEEQATGTPFLAIEPYKSKIFVIGNSSKDSTKLLVTTFLKTTNFKIMQLVWNGTDTSLTDKSELMRIVKNNTKVLYGYNLYHSSSLDSLKKLKAVEKMSLEDFKAFAIVYVKKWNEIETEFDKINIGYVAVFMNFQIITQSLLEIGYNPIHNETAIEVPFRKYSKHPQVKPIFDKRHKN